MLYSSSPMKRAIEEHVGKTYYSRGLSYYRNGRVASLEVKSDRIIGRVQGGRPEPYEVVIDLEKREIVESSCSCPMVRECKHVAALVPHPLSIIM